MADDNTSAAPEPAAGATPTDVSTPESTAVAATPAPISAAPKTTPARGEGNLTHTRYSVDAPTVIEDGPNVRVIAVPSGSGVNFVWEDKTGNAAAPSTAGENPGQRNG